MDAFPLLHFAVRANNVAATLRMLAGDNQPHNDPNRMIRFDLEPYCAMAPIHVAARSGSLLCLKALILLGADINQKDERGRTARHLVCTEFTRDDNIRDGMLDVLEHARAQRCQGAVPNSPCQPGCERNGNVNGHYYNTGGQEDINFLQEMENFIRFRRIFGKGANTLYEPKGNRMTRMLSIDGGGIRGLVPLVMLHALEQHMRRMDREERIQDLFDVFVGTSTGGIIALLFAIGRMSVLEIIKKYILLKDVVFKRGLFRPPYPSAPLEKFLKDNMGSHKRLGGLEKKVIIMCTDATHEPYDLKVYENIRPKARNNDLGMHLWRIGKRTGAAPGLFQLDERECIDGGIKANNPTLEALVELLIISCENEERQDAAVVQNDEPKTQEEIWNGEIVPGAVVSLGTSLGPRIPGSPDDVNFGWPNSVRAIFMKVAAAKKLCKMLIREVTRADGREVDHSRAWCRLQQVPFMRLNSFNPVDVEPNEKDGVILVNLMYNAHRYMMTNTRDMDVLLCLLLHERRNPEPNQEPNLGPGQPN